MSEAQNFVHRMHSLSGGSRLGAVGPPMSRQSEEFIMWLISQTPHGSTFSETLVALALDAKEYEADIETYKSLFRRLVQPQFAPELNDAELALLKELINGH